MNNPYYIKPRNPSPGVSDAYRTSQEELGSAEQRPAIPVGNYLQAAQGALQIGSDVGAQLNAARTINTGVPSQEFDAYGQPIYNLGEQTQYVNNINDRQMLGSTGGSVLRGAASGASAGAAFGPVGAAIGGAIGGIASGIGNIFGRKKIRRAKRKAQRKLAAAQNQFNEQTESASESLLARQAYQDQIAQNNPYGFPTNYY